MCLSKYKYGKPTDLKAMLSAELGLRRAIALKIVYSMFVVCVWNDYVAQMTPTYTTRLFINLFNSMELVTLLYIMSTYRFHFCKYYFVYLIKWAHCKWLPKLQKKAICSHKYAQRVSEYTSAKVTCTLSHCTFTVKWTPSRSPLIVSKVVSIHANRESVRQGHL